MRKLHGKLLFSCNGKSLSRGLKRSLESNWPKLWQESLSPWHRIVLAWATPKIKLVSMWRKNYERSWDGAAYADFRGEDVFITARLAKKELLGMVIRPVPFQHHWNTLIAEIWVPLHWACVATKVGAWRAAIKMLLYLTHDSVPTKICAGSINWDHSRSVDCWFIKQRVAKTPL